ncbi:MAG: rhodanese-like domain-containing protein [Chitinophagales bacterium]
MKTVTVQELKAMRDNNEDFQLIDVREEYEYEICNIEGLFLPLGDIPENIDKINTDKKVIIQCRSGARSARAIEWLEQTQGLENLYNLTGGIMAWREEIDNSLATY